MSAMAARSVNSQRRSRVIEPRNKDVAGAFVVMGARAASKSRYGEGCRSDRGQRAWQRHKRVPWEHERPVEVLRQIPEWSPPGINDQATELRLPGEVERTEEATQVFVFNRQRESAEKPDGSLSLLIVPVKAGERGRPEPGSREGADTVTGPS